MYGLCERGLWGGSNKVIHAQRRLPWEHMSETDSFSRCSTFDFGMAFPFSDWKSPRPGLRELFVRKHCEMCLRH